MIGKKTEPKTESQVWLVVNSKPFQKFVADLNLENVGKHKHKKEYNLPNGRNISISYDETVFLIDKGDTTTIGSLPEDNVINKPVVVYKGGVISEKRLKAFVEE